MAFVKLELIGNGNDWTTRILLTGEKATTPAGGLVLSVGFPEDLVARESGDPLLPAALDVFLFAPAEGDVRARGFHVKEGSANPPSRQRVTHKELEDVAVKAAKRAISEGKPVRGEVLDGLAGLFCKVSPWQATPNDPTTPWVVSMATWQSDPDLMSKPWWLVRSAVKPFSPVNYRIHLPVPVGSDSRAAGRSVRNLFKQRPDRSFFRPKTKNSVHFRWLDPLRAVLTWVNSVYATAGAPECQANQIFFRVTVRFPAVPGVWGIFVDRRPGLSDAFYEDELSDSIQSYTGVWQRTTFQSWFRANLLRREMNEYQRPSTMPSSEVFRLSLRMFMESHHAGAGLIPTGLFLLPKHVRVWLARLRKAPATAAAGISSLDQVARDYAAFFWKLCRESDIDIKKIKPSRLEIWFPDDLLCSQDSKQIHGKLVPPGVLDIRGNDCVVSPVDLFVAAAFDNRDLTDEGKRIEFADKIDVDQHELLRIINTDKELARSDQGVVKRLKPRIDALYQADGKTLREELAAYAKRALVKSTLQLRLAKRTQGDH